MTKITVIIIGIILTACSNRESSRLETWKEEVRLTELNFSEMAVKEGIAPAFLHFAAEDAVLNRNDSLIIGIDNIRARFNELPAVQGQLTWAPDFIDVAQSGDLAYTYGKYQYAAVDSTGNEIISNGVFHTVWKRQTDGSWKYVWD